MNNVHNKNENEYERKEIKKNKKKKKQIRDWKNSFNRIGSNFSSRRKKDKKKYITRFQFHMGTYTTIYEWIHFFFGYPFFRRTGCFALTLYKFALNNIFSSDITP